MTTFLSLSRRGCSLALARVARWALLAWLGACIVLPAPLPAAPFALPVTSTAGTRSTVFLTAVIGTSPVVTLQWATSASATGYSIYRRQFKFPPDAWVKIDELKGDATSFADAGRAAATTTAPILPAYTAAASNTAYEYEYQVIRTAAAGAADMDTVAYGYICTGSHVFSRDGRGTVVLITERIAAASLGAQLTTWTNDLISEGWQVIRHDVETTDTPAEIRALIKADYDADNSVNTVFLFGKVPYYQSGVYDWDNTGAKSWPSDAYYGDMITEWGPARTDLPNRVTLQVGRVDLSDLPTFRQTEVELLGQYLDKVHAYRMRDDEVILGSCVDKVNNGASQSFWRAVSTIVPGPYTPTTWNPCGRTLLGFIGGTGYGGNGHDHIDGVISSSDLAVSTSVVEPGVINLFYNLEGIGQWNTTNNLMRAALATPRTGLASIWVGRPNWYLHPLGMGETLGACARIAQNNPTSGNQYQPVTTSTGKVHPTLLGDPTLHIYPVKPPSNLRVTYSGSAARLTWDASTNRDAVYGYSVYRSTSPNGPFGDAERLNHTMAPGATTYTDPLPSNRAFIYYYSVRAVSYITTQSGLYHANSLGTAPAKLDRGVTLTATPASPRPAGTSIVLTATTPDNLTACTFTVTQNGVDEVFDATLGGTTATYIWTPAESGLCTITATATTANSGVFASDPLDYTITDELSAVSLDTTPNPSVAGVTVLVSATATGGADNRYQFLCNDVVVRDYTTSPTYAWTPAAAGSYDWTVNVKDMNGTDPTLVYTLVTPVTATVIDPLTIVTLDASPSSARLVTTPITLTALAYGGGEVLYQFLANGMVIQDYSPSPTCTWTPATDGIYALNVKARDLQGAVPTQAITSRTLMYRIALPLNSVLLQSNTPVTCLPGTAINLEAFASGGANRSYQFFANGEALPPVDAASSRYVWTPPATGQYDMTVQVSDLSSDDPLAYVESAALRFNVNYPLSGVTLGSLHTSCPLGGSVFVWAQATGGQDLVYQFRANDTVVKDFSAQGSCWWTPPATGKYYLSVVVKEGRVMPPPPTFASNALPLTVVPALDNVTLKVSPEGKSVVNGLITLTATAKGGDTVEYKFMYLLLDADNQVRYDASGNPMSVTLRDYAASPTYIWKPNTSGQYPLSVMVHDVKASDPDEAFWALPVNYTVVPILSGVTLMDIFPQSPATIGSTVTLQAQATGGTRVLYQFLAGSTVIRDFSPSSTCTWKPNGTGSINLTVRAKEEYASAATPVLVSPAVPYQVNTALSGVTLRSMTSIGVVNSPITLVATPAGGARMVYRFQQGANVLRMENASPTFMWVPEQAGVQTISVIATDQGGASLPVKRSASAAIQCDVAPLITLTPSAASPQREKTSVMLMANTFGLVNPSYAFSVSTLSTVGRWGAYKALTATKTTKATGVILWQPAKAGQYRVRVTVTGMASGKKRVYTHDLVYTIMK